MALGHRWTALAGLAVTLALPLQPAAGQDWFNWFGADDSVPRRPASGYVISRPGPGSSLFSPFSGFLSPFQPDGVPQDHGPFRTLCVRMCDGYYFPISHSTSSANLSHDAERCTASCGGDARLFYHANPGGDVETMLDLTGRIYGSYPTAFKYRRTLVAGCQCRPQPWAESELARHRAYAMAGKVADGKSEPAATDSQGAGDDAAAAASRPAARRTSEVEAAGATAAPPARARASRRTQHDGGSDWLFGGSPAARPKAPRSSYAASGDAR